MTRYRTPPGQLTLQFPGPVEVPAPVPMPAQIGRVGAGDGPEVARPVRSSFVRGSVGRVVVVG